MSVSGATHVGKMVMISDVVFLASLQTSNKPKRPFVDHHNKEMRISTLVRNTSQPVIRRVVAGRGNMEISRQKTETQHVPVKHLLLLLGADTLVLEQQVQKLRLKNKIKVESVPHSHHKQNSERSHRKYKDKKSRNATKK